MRYLMDTPLGVLSRWTSLAPARSASKSVELTSLTDGLEVSDTAASVRISMSDRFSSASDGEEVLMPSMARNRVS
ncbi:hypothetical protein FQZ97_1032940 [compost metagenome]